MLQGLYVTVGVTLLFVITFAVTLWSSVTIVREENIEILFVFGEIRAILEPGLNFAPPFVSSSYPIDIRTMQYETPDGSEQIPPSYHDDVKKAAEGHILPE